jgi:hypothetical protein
MNQPDELAVAAALADVLRIRGAVVAMFRAGLVLVLVGAVLAVWGAPWNLSGLAALFGLVLCATYSVAWRRVAMAGRMLRQGPFQRVRAIRWCRPGDGSNYAVSADDDDRSPDVVVRLPLRREVETEVEDWLAGEPKPTPYGGVPLLSVDGLLATGPIIPNRRAVEVWARRLEVPRSTSRTLVATIALILALLAGSCDAGLGPASIAASVAGESQLGDEETTRIPIELTASARGLGDDVEVIVSAWTDTPSEVRLSLLDNEGDALPDHRGGDALATGVLSCGQADHPTCTGLLLLELHSVSTSGWEGEWTVRATVVAQDNSIELPNWVTIEARLAATD